LLYAKFPPGRNDGSGLSTLIHLQRQHTYDGNKFAAGPLLADFIDGDWSVNRPLLTEEPGKLLVSLIRFVRPIAEKSGDAAPLG
jgi:hypothetical protein